MTENWLVIETSGRVGQIGLARDGTLVRTGLLDENRRHVRDLAPMVGSMLPTEELKPAEVTGVMVSIGPGSYTGLRVGIASAKAFAYATGCRLVAVPTFAAIALQAPLEAQELWVVADGLQGSIYVQSYERTGAKDELRIERAADVLPAAPQGAWFTGPGVEVYANLLPPGVSLVPESDRDPTLESLFRAGLKIAPLARQELFALEPLYLRGSSAEEKAKANEPRG